MGLFQILESYCTTLAPIIAIVKTVLYILQIGIPIVLVLMGTIDLGKAVLSSDDKAIKESTSRLIKRVIAAVAVFFVFTIVKLIMNIISALGAYCFFDNKPKALSGYCIEHTTQLSLF